LDAGFLGYKYSRIELRTLLSTKCHDFRYEQVNGGYRFVPAGTAFARVVSPNHFDLD
jgi:hypothetical protein